MTTAPMHDGPLDRLHQTLTDTGTLTVRSLLHWRNRPGAVVLGWLFPVLMIAMFIGLLGGALGTSSGGSYVDFVMPGALAMAMFFGLEGTMVAVSTDASKGVTDRFRSLPMSGVAVVAGRCVADMLHSVVSLGVVVATGLLFGWRPEGTVATYVAAIALLLLLRFAVLWIGVLIGLRAASPETVTAIQVAVWPILFLSSVFVDTSTMPGWLGTVAEANPLSATATATRELLGSPGGAGESWFAVNASALAVAWPLLLVLVFLPLSASTYRHLRR